MPDFGQDTFLYIGKQKYKTIYYFRGFYMIKIIDASDNELENLGEISNYQALTYLKISDNRELNSLKGIENCKQLEVLEMEDVPVNKFDVLAKLPKLKTVIVNNSVQAEAIKRVRPDVTVTGR
jgi:hypothetical protein